MSDIEVEVRGKLGNREYKTLEEFLAEHGKYSETKNRVLIDYSTFMKGEGVKDRTRDIRLRVTNGQPEIITKIGKWGGKEARRELSVKTEEGSFDTLVETYGVLGFTKGVLCVRNTLVYMYKNIEFALVEVPNHSYYFEAEKIVSSENKTNKAHKEIEEICKELELEIFSQQGFYDYIEILNEEANEIFDFEDYKEDYFKKRFNL